MKHYDEPKPHDRFPITDMPPYKKYQKCSECPYTLGIIKFVINPCPQCYNFNAGFFNKIRQMLPSLKKGR